MKFLFTFKFLLFYTLTFAQDQNNKINYIRKHVEQINKDSLYTTKTLNNEEYLHQMPDGGGQLTGYFKNGQLVKIIELTSLSSCINVTEYYLHNNQFIFIYIQGKEFQYDDSSATFKYNKQNVTMECRYYFENKKTIKSFSQGAIRCSGQPTKDMAQKCMDSGLIYKNLLEKKSVLNSTK